MPRKSSLFAFSLLFLIGPSLASAVWQPESVVAATPGRSTAVKLVASGCNLYAAWIDNSNLYQQVFFSRSRNGGETWTKARAIAEVEGTSVLGFDLVASGRRLHLVYRANSAELPRVFYQRSVNRGKKWRQPVLLSDSASRYHGSTVAAEGKDVFVAWTEDLEADSGEDFPKTRVRLVRSDNRGRDFQLERWLGRAQRGVKGPILAVGDGRLHVLWSRSERKPRGWVGGTYHRFSDTRGDKWTKRRLVSASLWGPDALVAAAGRLHLVWTGVVGYKATDVYYLRSTDRGGSWGSTFRINGELSNGVSPTLAASGDDVHIAWVGDWFETGPLSYERSFDGGETWVPSESLGRSAGWPGIAAVPKGQSCGGEVHLVYAWDDVFYRRATD